MNTIIPINELLSLEMAHLVFKLFRRWLNCPEQKSRTLFVDQLGFIIVHLQRNTSDVTIPLTSSDATEGTASPSSLTFTPQNYATPQTVTATGVDDSADDGDVGYEVVTGVATSAAPYSRAMVRRTCCT